MASTALETDIHTDPTTDEHTHTEFQLLITAAKQTIAKVWKIQTLVVAEVKHRMNKALIYAKMTVIENVKIQKFEKNMATLG